MQNQILTMQEGFCPGDRLNSLAIASQLGVSKTPVVYAINQLAMLNLVVVRARSGTYVSSPEDSDIRESFELLAQLELASVRLSRRPFPEAQLEQLSRLVDDTENSSREGDLPAFLDAGRAFHIAISALAGNGQLKDAYTDVIHQVYLAEVYIAQAPSNVAIEVSQDRVLTEVLRGGDLAQINRVIEDHWQQGWERYTQVRTSRKKEERQR